MKFLRDMLARRTVQGGARFGSPRPGLNPNDSATTAIEALKRKSGTPVQKNPAGSPKLSDMVGSGNGKSSYEQLLSDTKPKSAAPLNIWDMDDSAPATAATVSPVATPMVATPAVVAQGEEDAGIRRRQNRTKTRMLSFEPKDESVSDLFATAGTGTAQIDGQKAAVVMFPTGWLLVIDGPGRGASFPLNQGMSQIGRGSDQTVCLDFGDGAISRTYHAAIAFDTASKKFHVGHGGKSNIVRLNQKPLLSTEMIADGDKLQIGETILLLKVLCNETFNWGKTQPEGETDAVAFT